MSLAEANLELPANFAGIVKVFPLPNLVLFPAVIQPLHIFEPRYRRMMADALEGDQLIAIGTLKPSKPRKRSARPEIFPTLCIGRIVTHARLPDGRFNLLLCGIRRAKLIREIPAELPYRMADVQVLDPDPVHCADESSSPLRRAVQELFEELVLADDKLDRESFSGFTASSLPLGLLLDLITFSCGANVVQQQRVLESLDLGQRSRQVLRLLRARLAALSPAASSIFPPAFSLN